MSDYGDFCREQRDRKQRFRRHLHECPNCAIAFGGNGTKVVPGEKCHNCTWVAPATSAWSGKPWRTDA